MRYLLILPIVLGLAGCENFTAEDVDTVSRGFNAALGTYDRYQHPEYYRPAPVAYPPTYPVYPAY